MNIKRNNKKKKGFTLVELIVVLVILAILAAILIPALLGYIDRARSRKELLRAKDCLTMVQADLVERYAKYGDTLQGGNGKQYAVIGEDNVKDFDSKNGDINATDKPWAKKILSDLDLDQIDNGNGSKGPYCILIGIGSNHEDEVTGVTTTKHDKYTVYYIFYMETKTSEPLFYYNGTWSNHHPRINENNDILDENNVFVDGPLKGKRLQYYILSNKSGHYGWSNFWPFVKDFNKK